MKKFALLIMTSLALLTAHAVDIDYTNDSKIAAGLKLGMSTSPSFDAEIIIEYRPFRYIGANVGLQFITPFNQRDNVISKSPETENSYWEIDNYKDALYRIVAKAGLQFTTPAVMLTKGEMGLSLRLSPGIIIPTQTNSSVTVNNYQLDTDSEVENDNKYTLVSQEECENSGAKFCYWYARAELVLEYEENWEFAVGYTYNTLDLYGGSRNIVVDGTSIVIGKKEHINAFHLGLTYKF
ncbi:MAG: hypothetical protein IKT03_04205 [Muribaculaceae bacterium]|nr:hypothetical protein [Muribaculaceae bacterium]